MKYYNYWLRYLQDIIRPRTDKPLDEELLKKMEKLAFERKDIKPNN